MREHLVGLAAQDVDVALSPALRDEPPAGRSARVQAREQPLVVGDPVEGGGREDRVDGLVEVELEQVADAQVRVRPEPLAGGVDHRGRLVDRDHAPARQALDQRLRDPPGAAAGVEHGLIAAQLQPLEHLEPERLHRSGDAVVAGSVPLAYWHTSVRYHVRVIAGADGARRVLAGVLRAPITRESCPPCQAIGERTVPGHPASSTTSLAPGIASRVALGDGQRMAGVGLVAAGDDDRRHLDRRAARRCCSNGRERGTASSASATASGCSCAARRWRRTVCTVARSASGSCSRS